MQAQSTNTHSSNSEPWFSPKNILTLFEILAILGTALWTVYLFFKFEEKEKDLSISLLRNQNLQGELAVELSRLQIKRSQLDIEQMTNAQIAMNQEIEVTDINRADEDGKHLFLVQYNYSISNIGSQKNEVTYVVVHAFFAALPMPQDTLALEITEFQTKGDLKWKFLLSRGHYYSPKWKNGMAFDSYYGEKLRFEKGGGGTAELDAGELSKGSIDLLIRAKPYDLVGFEVRIGLNNAVTSADRWRLRKTTYLFDTH